MKMHIFARHGDLVINKETVTGDLVEARDVVFAGDSSGHPHVLVGACLMRREGLRTFVRVAKATKIEHRKVGGHKSLPIPAGDYVVTPLRERGNGADRAVED